MFAVLKHDGKGRGGGSNPSFMSLSRTYQPASAKDFHLRHSACERCRSKKLRCNGEKPTCNRCKSQGDSCVYQSQQRVKESEEQASGKDAVTTRTKSVRTEREQLHATPNEAPGRLLGSLELMSPDFHRMADQLGEPSFPWIQATLASGLTQMNEHDMGLTSPEMTMNGWTSQDHGWPTFDPHHAGDSTIFENTSHSAMQQQFCSQSFQEPVHSGPRTPDRLCTCLLQALEWHAKLEKAGSDPKCLDLDTYLSIQRTNIERNSLILQCHSCKESSSSITLVLVTCEKVLDMMKVWIVEGYSAKKLTELRQSSDMYAQLGKYSTNRMVEVSVVFRALQDLYVVELRTLLASIQIAVSKQSWSVQGAIVKGLQEQLTNIVHTHMQ